MGPDCQQHSPLLANLNGSHGGGFRHQASVCSLGVSAVSYTHLDVYKRQAQNGLPFTLRCLGHLHALRLQGKEALIISLVAVELSLVQLHNTCLLYTSRCV